MFLTAFTTIKDKRKFILFHFLITLSVFAYYLFSSANYADDYERLFSNGAWWGSNRYLASMFFNLIASASIDLHTTMFMGAFFNLLSLLTLSISAILLLHKFYQVNYTTTFFALGITLLPFFNEGLLYRYDSFVCMTLPILLIVVLLTNNFKSLKHELIATALTIYVVMSFYQPAINTYLSLIIYIAIKELVASKVIKTTLINLVSRGFVATFMVVFTLVINKLGFLEALHLDGKLASWVGSRADINIENPVDTIYLILNNISVYFKKMFVFKQSVGYLGYTLFIAFFVTIIYQITKSKSIQNKILRCALALFLFGSLFIAPTSLNLISANYTFTPRYAASFLLLSVLILNYLYANLNFKNRFLNTLKITILSTFIILSATYNVRILALLVKNYDYFKTEVTLLASNIINLPFSRQPKELKFVNFNLPKPNMDPYYPAIYYYGMYLTGINRHLNISTKILDTNNKIKISDAVLLKENMFYKFYQKDDTLIIEFKK